MPVSSAWSASARLRGSLAYPSKGRSLSKASFLKLTREPVERPMPNVVAKMSTVQATVTVTTGRVKSANMVPYPDSPSLMDATAGLILALRGAFIIMVIEYLLATEKDNRSVFEPI
jgi:hypothetical protein